jgi:hypothetical protein
VGENLIISVRGISKLSIRKIMISIFKKKKSAASRAKDYLAVWVVDLLMIATKETRSIRGEMWRVSCSRTLYTLNGNR